ncbi:hypothetical protein QUB56_28030 [Microcoleus sp. AR_TQ3_B6]|uniref:hypothetical protein n=1 Tax=Microcoleus sp. AR_TQ3_B6 TaxID=3055284 RepID=UPI002FCE9C2E
MEEDLDINGEPEIILLENLNLSQWSAIWAQIQYRIKLNAENHQAIAESGTAQIPVVEQNLAILPLTKNFLMVQAPGFIRGINPKSKIENPQAPAFIRGVNLKSKI